MVILRNVTNEVRDDERIAVEAQKLLGVSLEGSVG
jgi:hypothetical protein